MGRTEPKASAPKQPRSLPEPPRAIPADRPAEWNIPRVFDRLVEAVEILGRLPMAVRPRGYANAMPATAQERLSLLEQLQLEASGELERLHFAQNRVRLPVTSRQISRMDEALNWPLLYLADKPEVAKAVGLAALWAARKLDRAEVVRRCRLRGISPKIFHRRQIHGLQIIAQELTRARIPVT